MNELVFYIYFGSETYALSLTKTASASRRKPRASEGWGKLCIL
jgi:hypothetical protein